MSCFLSRMIDGRIPCYIFFSPQWHFLDNFLQTVTVKDIETTIIRNVCIKCEAFFSSFKMKYPEKIEAMLFKFSKFFNLRLPLLVFVDVQLTELFPLSASFVVPQMIMPDTTEWLDNFIFFPISLVSFFRNAHVLTEYQNCIRQKKKGRNLYLRSAL